MIEKIKELGRWSMKNSNYVTIFGALIFFLVFLPSVFAQPPPTSQMIMGYHISLGNGDCAGMECELSWINFEIPLGTDKPQYLKFIITPECWSSPPNENESYSLHMYCMNGFNETIDMKPNQCNPASPIVRWIDVNNTTYGYFIHETDYCSGFFGHIWCFFNHQNPTSTQFYQYEDFWCAFERPNNNTNRLPTEASIVVDALGLTNPKEETVIDIQRSTLVTIVGGIKDVFTINFNLLQIIYYLSISIIIILAFIVLIGGIPIVLKWVVKKVSGGK